MLDANPIRVVALLALCGCAGCGQPSIAAPSYDAEGAASQAFELYDKNSDGTLDKQELAASPPLFSALSRIDTDGDSAISRSELVERIKTYDAADIGAMTFRCQVQLNNKPLPDATVKLVPEPYLTSAVQPAEGKTASDGTAFLTIPGAEVQGVQCGLYRVEITSGEGGRAVPDRYNTATELGQEVSSDTPGLERGVTYSLRSS